MSNQLSAKQIQALEQVLIKLGMASKAALKAMWRAGIPLTSLRGITAERAQFLASLVEWERDEKWVGYFPNIPLGEAEQAQDAG